MRNVKPYLVTPHLNRLVKTAQMWGHNIRFYAEVTKIILNYHQILLLELCCYENLYCKWKPSKYQTQGYTAAAKMLFPVHILLR